MNVKEKNRTQLFHINKPHISHTVFAVFFENIEKLLFHGENWKMWTEKICCIYNWYIKYLKSEMSQ